MQQFCIVHVDNVATHIGLHCIVIVTWCGSECCVQTSKLLVAPLCVIACPIICFEDCKCDMGTLSWLNAGTLERAPTTLFDRLVRCSIHEHSLAILWYIHNKCTIIDAIHMVSRADQEVQPKLAPTAHRLRQMFHIPLFEGELASVCTCS